MAVALTYHEPDVLTVLILSSFLVISNIVNHVLDTSLYCGIVGQIFVGVAFGTPGGKLLSEELQEVIVQLGYLGLILIVYEGGLATSFASVKANFWLSIRVAATGIALPISLSFVLQALTDATLLQAFAGGAALCSTSLGTTFAVLSSSNLASTRLGIVLTTAAMLDDIVGLVLVQVISNLGGSASSFEPITVVRPMAVSVGLVVVLSVVCRFVVKPFGLWLNTDHRTVWAEVIHRTFSGRGAAPVVHTSLLVGFVTGAGYAGTSVLFAAYLAGAFISWWDADVMKPTKSLNSDAKSLERGVIKRPFIIGGSQDPAPSASTASEEVLKKEEKPSTATVDSETALFHPVSGVETYGTYCAAAVRRILKPFFFASIGFAIPLTQMFGEKTVWCGLVYTTLMLFSKLVTGLWLVRFSRTTIKIPLLSRHYEIRWRSWRLFKPASSGKWPSSLSNINRSTAQSISNDASARPNEESGSVPAAIGQAGSQQAGSTASRSFARLRKPLSLYPAAILGSAMVARGEIGFLIISIAESKGIFASDVKDAPEGSSEIFLIAVWAITLCTIIGPITVGLLVRRVRKLQTLEHERTAGSDPLGIWGMD